MKKLVFFLIAIAALISCQDEFYVEPCYTYNPDEVLVSDEFDVDEMIGLVNKARTEYIEYTNKDGSGVFQYTDLSELTLDSSLTMAAQIQCEYMFVVDDMTHVWCDGTNIIDRLLWSGYHNKTVGENILYSTCRNDSKYILQIWYDSEPHRNNILNKNFNIIGIAKKGIYWTMVLGYKRPS